MSVTRGLVLSALCGWALTFSPAVPEAQVYEAARRSLDFAPDQTSRYPRLLGMGRLSLVSDVHNRLNLWDFAGNPVGVLNADTSSTVDLWPETSSAAGTQMPAGGGRERQYLGGREMRVGYEAWRRSPTTAYGFLGGFGALRSDRPYDESTVLRGRLDEPRVMAVLGGRMPRLKTDRIQYELHASYQAETSNDEYRSFFSNAVGDYLGRRGDLSSPPNFFDPEELRASTLGGGAGLSLRMGPWMTAALGASASSSRIEGANSDLIHDTGFGEDRPYYKAQLDFVGRFGALEYGLDGRTWTSASEERFVFTLKAGRNQDPFTGRGKVLDREEDGQQGRGHLRWTWGSFEANLAADRSLGTVDVTPPTPGDPTSFNYFLDVAANRTGADSLALPDSVRRTRSRGRSWHVGYGATWRIPGGRGLIGLEYHLTEETFEHWVYVSPVPTPINDVSFAGAGPDRRTWDVRGGIEYACGRAVKGRLGYIRRFDDRDERVSQDEFTSRTMTVGLGLMPPGSVWGLDLGWALELIDPDFATTTEPKESRQQLGAQLRWVF
jgi:hypothetical protein